MHPPITIKPASDLEFAAEMVQVGYFRGILLPGNDGRGNVRDTYVSPSFMDREGLRDLLEQKGAIAIRKKIAPCLHGTRQKYVATFLHEVVQSTPGETHGDVLALKEAAYRVGKARSFPDPERSALAIAGIYLYHQAHRERKEF